MYYTVYKMFDERGSVILSRMISLVLYTRGIDHILIVVLHLSQLSLIVLQWVHSYDMHPGVFKGLVLPL